MIKQKMTVNKHNAGGAFRSILIVWWLMIVHIRRLLDHWSWVGVIFFPPSLTFCCLLPGWSTLLLFVMTLSCVVFVRLPCSPSAGNGNGTVLLRWNMRLTIQRDSFHCQLIPLLLNFWTHYRPLCGFCLFCSALPRSVQTMVIVLMRHDVDACWDDPGPLANWSLRFVFVALCFVFLCCRCGLIASLVLPRGAAICPFGEEAACLLVLLGAAIFPFGESVNIHFPYFNILYFSIIFSFISLSFVSFVPRVPFPFQLQMIVGQLNCPISKTSSFHYIYLFWIAWICNSFVAGDRRSIALSYLQGPHQPILMIFIILLWFAWICNSFVRMQLMLTTRGAAVSLLVRLHIIHLMSFLFSQSLMLSMYIYRSVYFS